MGFGQEGREPQSQGSHNKKVMGRRSIQANIGFISREKAWG